MKPTERVQAEIKQFGGERKLASMLEAERKVWEQQALFLSYFRETDGDMESACLQSGVLADVAVRWYEDNELDFIDRQDTVLAGVGHKIGHFVTKQILAKEIKSPGIIKLMLEGYLPTIFGDATQRKTPEGQEILDKIREMNTLYAQQVGKQEAAEDPEEEQVAEPKVIDFAAEFQKRTG